MANVGNSRIRLDNFLRSVNSVNFFLIQIFHKVFIEWRAIFYFMKAKMTTIRHIKYH